MKKIKILSLLILQLLWAPIVFSQETGGEDAKLEGKWDVVLEMKSSKLMVEYVDETKKRAEKKSGNSNIALYNFNADGKFKLSSIKDYSQGNEEGTFLLSEDKTKIDFKVKYPKHLKLNKQSRFVKVKTKLLYLDKQVLVLRKKGITYYMRRVN